MAVLTIKKAHQQPNQSRLLTSLGLVIALGVPVIAIVDSKAWSVIPPEAAAILLAAVPWLILGWVLFIEHRPLASIGLRPPVLSTLGFVLAGIAVNLGISLGVGSLNSVMGLHEATSDLMTQLVRGHGIILVLLVTNGAFLTEIAFRGYAIERIGEMANGRLWVGAAIQIVVTTCVFIIARGLAHGLVWLVDDLIFSLFYIWRRDTVVCVAAHAVPNFIASMLVALGLAS